MDLWPTVFDATRAFLVFGAGTFFVRAWRARAQLISVIGAAVMLAALGFLYMPVGSTFWKLAAAAGNLGCGAVLLYTALTHQSFRK